MKALIRQNLKLIVVSYNFAKYVHDTTSDPDIKRSAHKVTVECENAINEVERYRKVNK